jgi:hypothetical protein
MLCKTFKRRRLLSAPYAHAGRGAGPFVQQPDGGHIVVATSDDGGLEGFLGGIVQRMWNHRPDPLPARFGEPQLYRTNSTNRHHNGSDP